MARPNLQKAASTNAEINRQKALDMHVAGMTYRQIGASLGVSHMSAFRYVQQCLQELADMRTEKAEAYRESEDQRLDDALRRVRASDAYKAGEAAAINAYVKLSESRRKLWGIDKPQRMDVRHQVEAAGPFFDDEVDHGPKKALPAEE